MVKKRRYSNSRVSIKSIQLTVVLAVIVCIIVYYIKSFKINYNGISSNFYIPKTNRGRNSITISSNPKITATTEAEGLLLRHDFLQPLQIVIEENQKFLEENHVDETTYRSGSTFFGEVFSSHPAVFYHYEPLARFGFQELATDNGLEEALVDLRYLSECNYEELAEYMEFVRNDSSIFQFNDKLYSGCQYLSQDCYLPNYPSTICSMFPIHLFKILRIKVSDLKPFLDDENFHIFLLVRDPRAVYASRRRLEWCTSTNRCMNMSIQCSIVKDDLTSINELQLDYPGQIHLIRYEDVANEPMEEFKKIFDEIGIPWHTSVQNSIELHTKREMDSPWSTYRISQTRVDKWRDELSSEAISYIEDVCEPVLSELYKGIDIDI